MHSKGSSAAQFILLLLLSLLEQTNVLAARTARRSTLDYLVGPLLAGLDLSEFYSSSAARFLCRPARARTFRRFFSVVALLLLLVRRARA